MPNREEQIADMENRNISEYLERGPGVRYSTRTWVVARDRERKKVLIGGLGSAGVGQMWFSESPTHAETFGYADAPEARAEP